MGKQARRKRDTQQTRQLLHDTLDVAQRALTEAEESSDLVIAIIEGLQQGQAIAPDERSTIRTRAQERRRVYAESRARLDRIANLIGV